jgi:hypothetical protein
MHYFIGKAAVRRALTTRPSGAVCACGPRPGSPTARSVSSGLLALDGGGGSFTPARRAFDNPIAIACFVDRAPCLPSRTCSISLVHEFARLGRGRLARPLVSAGAFDGFLLRHRPFSV